jgi:hypothetical protein
VTGQHNAEAPRLGGLGPRSATVTVTLRDGSTVSTFTWSTCAGVGQFVADLLGEPTARAHTNLEKESSCSTG